jgi:hypothetical protein
LIEAADDLIGALLVETKALTFVEAAVSLLTPLLDPPSIPIFVGESEYEGLC